MAKPLRNRKAKGGNGHKPVEPGLARSGPDSEVVVSAASKVESAREKVKSAQSALQTTWKEVESLQVHKLALKDALKVRKMDPEGRDAYLTNFLRYMRDLNIAWTRDLMDFAGIHEPLSDAEATLVEATASGKAAGEAGEPIATNPFNTEQQDALHQAWRGGWLDGQKVRADALGPTHDPAAADMQGEAAMGFEVS